YILKIDKTSGSDVATDQPLEYYEDNWADDARYSESLGFRSQYDIFGNALTIAPFGPPYHENQYLETYFLYEHPKSKDITNLQKQYIQDYIHAFETALLQDDFGAEQRTYTDYIDSASFADYFLLNELTGNIDAYRLSTYLHKNRGDATANLLIDNGLIDRNYSRWTGISVDYLQSINDLKNYLSNRLEWMDATIQAF
ncbi:MAG: hypothetical protein EBT72_07600, partial [Flavobacteriia bacterium]|nr:hypothetical protein [Flavobacteriia bacterium]